MTRQDQLTVIRDACIKANSELIPDCKAVSGELSRPIHLADVLLAIGHKYNDGRLMVNNLGGFRYYWSGTVMPGWEDIAMPRYNLSKDDLTLQSDECISFLADLLK